MKKTRENIVSLIKRGASVRINTSDFRFSELQDIAHEAATQECKIAIRVNSGMTYDELQHLSIICKDCGIEFDLTE